MNRRSRKRIATVLATILVVSAMATAASAGHSWISRTETFPDSCKIYGSLEYDSTNDWTRASVSERENCARLDVRLRYKTTAGYWTTAYTGYQFASFVTTGVKITWLAPDYSDHNGDNDNGGTAYGFRLNW